jgi:hypothetical protein
MTHGELTREMARGGRNPLGNREIARTNGSTPVIGYCPIQTRRVGKLDSMVEPRPRQRLHRQWDATSQGTHEQQNQPPPRNGIIGDQEAGRCHAARG